MMGYFECEEQNIYTSLRLGTPAALKVCFVVTSGTRRPLRSTHSSSMVSVSEKTSRPSVESPGLKLRVPAPLVSPYSRLRIVELSTLMVRISRRKEGPRRSMASPIG